MARDRVLAARKFPSVIVKSTAGHYSLDFHAEQEPNAVSRVGLAEERDALGMQKLLIDWRYTPQDVATVREAVRVLAAIGAHNALEYQRRSKLRLSAR